MTLSRENPAAAATQSLQRITTEHIEAEDRVRLAGEAGEKTVVLWLTQRLLNRLVPHLCKWLNERVDASSFAELKQEFAQQKARAELAPQPPVRADAETPAVLAHSVGLKSSRAGLVLQFKDVDGNVFISLQLQPKPLRQWLNIVYDQYQRAGWPTTVWPAWVADAKPSQTSRRAAVLH